MDKKISKAPSVKYIKRTATSSVKYIRKTPTTSSVKYKKMDSIKSKTPITPSVKYKKMDSIKLKIPILKTKNISVVKKNKVLYITPHELYTRNLAESDLNYIIITINDIYNTVVQDIVDNLKNISEYSSISGGTLKEHIKYNITSEFNRYLALDNIHDFAVKPRGKTGKILQHKDYFPDLDNLINNDGSISTFEDIIFENIKEEYRQKNKISYIHSKELDEYLNKKKRIFVEGDIFIDVSPILVKQLIDYNNVINTIATYFDSSVTSEEKMKIKIEFKRYNGDDVKYFNEALNILKNNYRNLNNITINLIDANIINNNITGFTFNISKNTISKEVFFETGTKGHLTVPAIVNNILKPANNPLRKYLKEFLEDSEINALLILMKGLGDFSQIYLGFKLNNKVNLLTTNDKFLFNIALYINMNKNIIFNKNEEKDLYLLLGTGSNSKGTTQGNKILIYNNKEYFLNKTLKILLILKYNNDVNIINFKNKNIIFININDKYIPVYNIELIDLNTTIINNNIEKYITLYTKICNVIDHFIFINKDISKYNDKLASINKLYEDKYNELIKIINVGYYRYKNDKIKVIEKLYNVSELNNILQIIKESIDIINDYKTDDEFNKKYAIDSYYIILYKLNSVYSAYQNIIKNANDIKVNSINQINEYDIKQQSVIKTALGESSVIKRKRTPKSSSKSPPKSPDNLELPSKKLKKKSSSGGKNKQ